MRPGITNLRSSLFPVILCFLPPAVCLAQPRSIPEELRFAQYLIDSKQYPDAVYILQKQIIRSEKDPAVSDSINYFLGWCYFNLKNLDSSSVYLSKVKEGPFYSKSVFYNTFNLAYEKKIMEARTLLTGIHTENDSSLSKLKNMEFAGLALLELDYQRYEACAKKFSYAYFPIAEEEKKFAGHYSDLKKARKKSPALAGVMSAVLPGAGKMYGGYKGQGLAAFLTVGVLGVSAYESYHHLGYKSPHFIALGSLFTIFYIGNIWGSVLSVKLAREHQLREINDEILFDMHIPLRRIFN